VRTAIYDRALLRPGMALEGPAIVNEQSATSVLPPGTRASVDRFHDIVIDTGVARAT
jgi:N-methylhydantoinase A